MRVNKHPCCYTKFILKASQRVKDIPSWDFCCCRQTWRNILESRGRWALSSPRSHHEFELTVTGLYSCRYHTYYRERKSTNLNINKELRGSKIKNATERKIKPDSIANHAIECHHIPIKTPFISLSQMNSITSYDRLGINRLVWDMVTR